MNAGVTVNEVADLTRLQSESRILKGLLHVAPSEGTEITPVGCGATLTALLSNTSEILKGFDLSLDLYNILSILSFLTLDAGNSLSLGASDRLVSVRVVRVTGLCVLKQDVSGTHLRFLIHI